MSTFSPVDVLNKIVEDTIIDTRLRSAVTLDLLYRQNRTYSVNYSNIYWDAFVSSGVSAWASMATAGTNQTTGTTVQASLAVGGYKVYHQFSLSRVALKDAASRGVAELKRTLQVHVDDALLTIRRKVNEAIWLGDGTAGYGGFVGMPVVLSNTLAYAGINPATHTRWKPGVLLTNATARALTKDLLLDFREQETTAEVMHDTVITSPATAKTYHKLFDSIAGSLQIANNAGGRSQVDVSNGERAWDGIPILEDPQCPSGQIVTAASQYIDLVSYDLAGADAGVINSLGFKDNFTTIRSTEVGGLRVNVALLPELNPGTLTFQIFCLPQLKVRNRLMVQGILNLN
jgi:hypothetical protein